MSDITRVITFPLDQEFTEDLNGTVVDTSSEGVTFQSDSVTFDGDTVVW